MQVARHFAYKFLETSEDYDTLIPIGEIVNVYNSVTEALRFLIM